MALIGKHENSLIDDIARLGRLCKEKDAEIKQLRQTLEGVRGINELEGQLEIVKRAHKVVGKVLTKTEFEEVAVSDLAYLVVPALEEHDLDGIRVLQTHKDLITTNRAKDIEIERLNALITELQFQFSGIIADCNAEGKDQMSSATWFILTKAKRALEIINKAEQQEVNAKN